jgi:hypothetical protein
MEEDEMVASRVRREMHTQFWFENMKGRDHFGDLGVDGRIILKWV